MRKGEGRTGPRAEDGFGEACRVLGIVMLIYHGRHLAAIRGRGQAALKILGYSRLQFRRHEMVSMDARHRIFVMAAMLIQEVDHRFWDGPV